MIEIAKNIYKFDPFVPEWLHYTVISDVFHKDFKWEFPHFGITPDVIDIKNLDNCCFGNYIEPSDKSSWTKAPGVMFAFSCWSSTVLDQWPVYMLGRARINLYVNGQNTDRHKDHSQNSYWSLLYYLTDTDGGTEIEGTVIKEKSNTAILFPSHYFHGAIPSKTGIRANVNYIFQTTDRFKLM